MEQLVLNVVCGCRKKCSDKGSKISSKEIRLKENVNLEFYRFKLAEIGMLHKVLSVLYTEKEVNLQI